MGNASTKDIFNQPHRGNKNERNGGCTSENAYDSTRTEHQSSNLRHEDDADGNAQTVGNTGAKNVCTMSWASATKAK